MTEEKLIRKLKAVSLPKIDLAGQRADLRLSLLSSYQSRKRVWFWERSLYKMAALGTAAVFLLLILFSQNQLPMLLDINTFAEAKEIAVNDSGVQELIKQGAVIGDIKITDGKAYVLVQLPEKIETKARAAQPAAAVEIQLLGGKDVGVAEPLPAAVSQVFLAEVDFKDKKVKSVKPIQPTFSPLSEEEKNLIEQTAAVSDAQKADVSQEAKIIGLEVIRPNLKIFQENESLEILPGSGEKKEVFVVYEEKENRWRIKIDLNPQKLEEVGGGNIKNGIETDKEEK